jgi:hypothetical protein
VRDSGRRGARGAGRKEIRDCRASKSTTEAGGQRRCQAVPREGWTDVEEPAAGREDLPFRYVFGVEDEESEGEVRVRVERPWPPSLCESAQASSLPK